MKLIDLSGKRFGLLVVIERAEDSNKKTKWLCQCDCGNTCIVSGTNLKTGNTRSCGCLHTTILKNQKTHGLTNHPLYRIYLHMKGRCYTKTDRRYKNYGGRGIKICDEWLEDFMNFYNWSIKNGYEPNKTLDRINNNMGYSPDNCRWTTMQVQANNRSSNHYITYNGKTMSASDWSREIGVAASTIIYRDNSGMPPEKVLSPHVRRSKRNKYDTVCC